MPADTPAAFFSYCREDSDFALRLAEDLKAVGANVWMDQLDIEPGTPWDRAIENALMNCPYLLVVLSPVSVTSDNVRDEVSFALSKQKRVIPVLYRDCDVPFRVARLQHIDFRADYDRGLTALLKVLGVSRPVATSDATAPAFNKEAHPAAAPDSSARRLVGEQPAEWDLREECKQGEAHEHTEQQRTQAAQGGRLERMAAQEKASPVKVERHRLTTEQPTRERLNVDQLQVRAGRGQGFWILGVSSFLLLVGLMFWTAYRGNRENSSRSDTTETQPERQPRSVTDGIVTYGGLMWTGRDNGDDINWAGADRYCRGLTLAGFSGWRLPTFSELKTLYHPRKYDGFHNIKEPFRLSAWWVWSSTDGRDYPSSKQCFGFVNDGEGSANGEPDSRDLRALCVRRPP